MQGIGGLSVRPEATAIGGLSVELEPIGYTNPMTDIIVYRSSSDSGYTSWIELNAFTWPCHPCADTSVQDGMGYRYRLVPISQGSDGAPHEGAVAESRAVEASLDPYPPEGSIVINDGALTTSSRLVTLSIVADDLSPEHGDPDEGARPGDPSSALMMRLSNDDDLTGVAWQPYQSTVENWDLGPVPPGSQAWVYVQFMDTRGNIGASGLGMMDSIIYRAQAPHSYYLPLIFRGQ